jgi:hypothetical protein
MVIIAMADDFAYLRSCAFTIIVKLAAASDLLTAQRVL